MKEGSPDQDNIEFIEHHHTIDEILGKLNHLETLYCDEDLEFYVIENKSAKNFLPNLKTINKVTIKITDKETREKEKKIRKAMDEIWKYVGTYRLVTPDQMDEESIWYLMDEVGSSIRHSDKPNIAVHPFIYSPNLKLDEKTITYSVSYDLD